MSDYTPKQFIFSNGRRVGSVERGIFKKTVHASRHFLRYPEPAIAFSFDTLQQAESLGAESIEIKDGETGYKYFADIAFFRANAFDVNYGEPQLALSLKEWTMSAPYKSKALRAGESRFKPAPTPRDGHAKKGRGTFQMPFKGWH